VKNALKLELLETRSLPTTSVFTTAFSHLTTFTDRPLASAIPQFDTMGGQRTLQSVQIISNIELDSSISGTVTNDSSTAATEQATVTDASISVTGAGFTGPLTVTQATLLDTGPLNCPGETTRTIGPFSASLTDSSDITLTGAALAPFIGTGTLSYTTSSTADSADQVTGGSNIAKHTIISATGTATVEIIYTFVTNPLLVTTASPALTLGAAAPTLIDSATLSRGTNPTGAITFTLTGPGGFSFTHTDIVSGNGTYTAGATLPAAGLVAGTYTWSAHYSGDGNNASANDEGGTAEQTVVKKARPSVVTTASPNVTVGATGATLSDSATLSGGLFETGTIRFTLMGPGGLSLTYVDAVHGNGTYAASATLTAGAIAGTYTWSAVYSGDGNNLTAIDQGGTAEQTLVSRIIPPESIVPPPLPGQSTISGSVFLDPAQQGNFVPPDIALPGVTITLTGVTSNGTSVIASVVTDINGHFSFTGLQPGSYDLVESQPPNFIPGTNFPGDLGGTPNVDVIDSITVGASQTGVNYRFTQLSLTPQAISKQQLLSSSIGVEQLTAPAGTGVTTVANPFAASGLAPGGHYLVTGAGFGQSPQVSVYNPTGKLIAQFYAYDPRFQGGVRVALGDVNGDGTPDIIAAAGPGGSPDIRVFDGHTGALSDEFMAYDPHWTGGVFVAAGDINHDGNADIVTSPDAGGGPEVKVFSGKALTQGNTDLLADFMACDPRFNGGVRVALGDVDHDGTLDLITGPGAGSGPDVRIFGGHNLAVAGPNSDIIRELLAFAPNYSGGVNVAAIDTNGDGFTDIVVSGATTSAEVRVFSGLDGTLLADFLAENHIEVAGINVAAVLGPTPAIVTAGGSTSLVQVLDASTHAVLDSFFAAPSQATGVYVGGI
jgi:hypothetical protein